MDTKQQLGPGNGHHCMSALAGLKMGGTGENRLKAGLVRLRRRLNYRVRVPVGKVVTFP